MSFVPLRFIQTHLSSLILYFCNLFWGLLGRDPSKLGSPNNLLATPAHHNEEEYTASTDAYAANAPPEQDLLNHFPPTEQQIEDSIRQFIDSINTDAVCDLASRHNSGKTCKIISKDNGSFNICFIVHFEAEDKTQVVRIPIAPVVRDGWGKVLNEATTLRYVRDNTTIPIPRVLAHGIHDALVEGVETPFMIMDLIPGQQLHTKTFLHATRPQREQLYTDIIDIMAQLRNLEFPTGGSLMPASDNECSPTLGPMLSMTANEFERNSGRILGPKTFRSMKHFVDYHCRILTDLYQLPVERLSYRDAKMELFALNSFSKEISKCIDSIQPDPPFILAHPDLRFGNIFIDDNFHILGIIDWEFTITIPLPLFTPPPWITGDDPDTLRVMRGLVRGPLRGDIFTEFREVLGNGRDTYSDWAKLWEEWGFQQETTGQENALIQELSPIAQILRHPSSLMTVYYSSIFRRLFGPEANRDAESRKFFDHPDNKSLALRIELQIEDSKRYTHYLESKGLLVEDVQTQKIQEYLAKTEYLVRAA